MRRVRKIEMRDKYRTKDQLLEEVVKLRRHLARLEAFESKHKKAEGLAAVAGERLKVLLRSSPAVIYCAQPSEDFSPTFLSENVLQQLGYEARAFTEDPGFWANRLHPEDKPQIAALFQTLFEKDRLIHEFRFLHKEGTYRWIQGDMKLMRDGNKRPVEIVGFWIDITDRKHVEEALRESENKYRTIFETAGTATAIAEEDTTLSIVNTIFEQMSGFSKEEIEGKKSWTDFVPEEYVERMKAYHLLRRINPNAAPSGYESRFQDRGGRLHDIYVKVAMIPGTTRSVASILDITKLKQTEADIKGLNEALERRVLERTAQLEEANKELEAFAYSISHDLRTPLLVIAGFVRSLMEKHSHQLDDKGHHFLDIINTNTHNLLQLLEELLVFSRLGSHPMKPCKIDMNELAKTLFEELKATAPGRTLQLNLKPLAPVRGDPTMMRQILTNLLSNAIKFTRPRKTGVIEIGCISEEMQIVYYVKDNGVGFDMKQATNLFNVFQRLHTPEEFEGSGIGLATVRNLVQRQGGWVWAEGKIDEGSLFYFSIPNVSQNQ
jgi:PAS domain S-box-containing protein